MSRLRMEDVKMLTLLLALCLLLTGCTQPALEAGPVLPVIDPATGEGLIDTPITLYNSYFGLEITLPVDTRIYELENLGAVAGDLSSDDMLTQTHYGDTSVYSLFDITLDRGGEPNLCRVIGAVEQLTDADSLDDFAERFSRRLELLSTDKDYQITLEGSESAKIDGHEYMIMTFTETEPDEPMYRYEAYLSPINGMDNTFLTLVLFYEGEDNAGAGQAVGRQYIESAIKRHRI